MCPKKKKNSTARDGHDVNKPHAAASPCFPRPLLIELKEDMPFAHSCLHHGSKTTHFSQLRSGLCPCSTHSKMETDFARSTCDTKMSVPSRDLSRDATECSPNNHDASEGLAKTLSTILHGRTGHRGLKSMTKKKFGGRGPRTPT